MFLQILTIIGFLTVGNSEGGACTPNSHNLLPTLNALKERGYLFDRIFMSSTIKENLFYNGENYGWGVLRRNKFLEKGTNYYKLGGYAAIIVDGCSPPETSYYGFGTYIYEQETLDGKFTGKSAFVNMGNGLNFKNIKRRSDQPVFSGRTTYVTSADDNTINDIIEDLEKSQIQKNEVNIDKINATNLKMGSKSRTTFYTILRTGIPANIDDTRYYFENIASEFISNVFVVYKNSSYGETETQPSKQVSIDDRIDRKCGKPATIDQTQDQSEYTASYNRLSNIIVDTLVNNFKHKLVKSYQVKPTEYNPDKCTNDTKYCRGVSPDALFFESFTSLGCHVEGNFQPSCGFKMHQYDTFIVQAVNHAEKSVRASTFIQETLYDTFGNIAANHSDAFLTNSAFGWGHYNPENTDNLWAFVSKYTTVVYTRPGLCIKDLVDKGIPCVEIPTDKLPDGQLFNFVHRSYYNPCTKTGQSVDQVQPVFIMQFDSEELYKFTETWLIVTWVIVGVCIACLIPFLVFIILDCCCDDI